MKVVVIYNDNSVSWVHSYSYKSIVKYEDDKKSISGSQIRVNLTDDIKTAAEWGDDYGANDEVFKTIRKGLLYHNTDIKGIYSSKDELYLRHIKISKLKTLI
jgi:hypothetical protein